MGKVMIVDWIADRQIRPPLIFPDTAKFWAFEPLFYSERDVLYCYLSYTCTVTEKWEQLVALYKGWYAQWKPRFRVLTGQTGRHAVLNISGKGTELPGEMLISFSERMSPKMARRLGVPEGTPWINAGIDGLRELAEKLEAKARGRYPQNVSFPVPFPHLSSL